MHLPNDMTMLNVQQPCCMHCTHVNATTHMGSGSLILYSFLALQAKSASKSYHTYAQDNSSLERQDLFSMLLPHPVSCSCPAYFELDSIHTPFAKVWLLTIIQHIFCHLSYFTSFSMCMMLLHLHDCVPSVQSTCRYLTLSPSPSYLSLPLPLPLPGPDTSAGCLLVTYHVGGWCYHQHAQG